MCARVCVCVSEAVLWGGVGHPPGRGPGHRAPPLAPPPRASRLRCGGSRAASAPGVRCRYPVSGAACWVSGAGAPRRRVRALGRAPGKFAIWAGCVCPRGVHARGACSRRAGSWAAHVAAREGRSRLGFLDGGSSNSASGCASRPAVAVCALCARSHWRATARTSAGRGTCKRALAHARGKAVWPYWEGIPGTRAPSLRKQPGRPHVGPGRGGRGGCGRLAWLGNGPC